MSANRGSPFDALFQALTERMGIAHTAVPDTDPTQRDRIEWRNARVGGIVSRGYRKTNTVTVGFLPIAYDVSVYGATELEVAARCAELGGWLDYLAGPKQGASDAGDGYDVGKGGPITGGEGIAGYGCKLPVTLYLAVLQQVWTPRTVVSVAVTVITTDIAGQNPEQALP